jgi:ABC-2 type transport system ATP-binding protein
MTNIQIEHLTKRFGRVVAADDLSFAVQEGRVTGFLGANGSGKTTTMRVLLGLSDATRGRATIGGRTYAELASPIREVGAVLSDDTFHPGRSAAQHLSVMAIAAELDRSRIDATLEAVGLTGVAGRKVGGYSLGMRQRLSLAAALLGDPHVLVLDEPLNGLDPDGITWFRAMVRGFAGRGGTVLLSSHLLAEVSHTVDDVVVIGHGRLLAAAPLHELGGKAVTVVRTPHASVLMTALLAAGHPARRTGDREVRVPGVGPDAVGLVAAHEGVVVTGLSEERDDLEDLFRDITTATTGEGSPS